MGYIVGRNSSPLVADSRHSDKPAVVDGSARPNPAATVIPPADTPAPAPAETPAAKPAEETPAPPPAQVKPEPKAAEKTPEKDKKADKKSEKTEKAEKEKEKSEKPAKASASPTPNQPVTGAKYLQVAAVAKAEAQLFVDVLAKKGFTAIYAQHPDQPQTYRVLVGPLRDTGAISKAREDLEKAGFPGRKALVRNY